MKFAVLLGSTCVILGLFQISGADESTCFPDGPTTDGILVPSNEAELKELCRSLQQSAAQYDCALAQSSSNSSTHHHHRHRHFFRQQSLLFKTNYHQVCSTPFLRSAFQTKLHCYNKASLASVVRQCHSRFLTLSALVSGFEKGTDQVVAMCGAALTTRDCLVHGIRAAAVQAQGCIDESGQTQLVGKHIHQLKVLFINLASHETLKEFFKIMTDNPEEQCPEESSWQDWSPRVPEYIRRRFTAVFKQLAVNPKSGFTPLKSIKPFVQLLQN